MKTIGIYRRVSTTLESQESSIDNQLSRIESYINFTFQEEQYSTKDYCDTASGTSIEGRPQMKRLIQDIQAGNIDVVVAADLSRLFRKLKDCLYFFELTEKCNCQVLLLKEKMDTSTAFGKAQLHIMSALNEMESGQISERVTAGIHATALKGKHSGGTPPIGYDKKWEPDIEGVKTVELIFTKYLETNSLQSTAQHLNKIQRYTVGGRKWSSASISLVLHNRSYISEIEIHKGNKGKDVKEKEKYQTVPAIHQAIISAEIFERVQGQLIWNEKHNRKKAMLYVIDYPLSGILKCKCGEYFTGCSMKDKKGKVFKYYQCTGCRILVRGDYIEPAIEGVFSTILKEQPELIPQSLSIQRDINVQRLREVEVEIQGIDKKKGSNKSRRMELLLALGKMEDPEIIHRINIEIKDTYSDETKMDKYYMDILQREAEMLQYDISEEEATNLLVISHNLLNREMTVDERKDLYKIIFSKLEADKERIYLESTLANVNKDFVYYKGQRSRRYS